jgi:hypothetical protein
MRDIKFRGIKKETKEWLYGGYFSNTDEEGLEHLYLKFTTETSLRPYNGQHRQRQTS